MSRDLLWANLPKLADLPPLKETIDALNMLADQFPEHYPQFWLAALHQVGSSASTRIDADGQRFAMIGYPCDPDGDERALRIDAIREHYHQTPITRDQLLDFLEANGLVDDHRPRPISEIIAAARDFLVHGGRLMINHEGALENRMPVERILSDDALNPEGALAAARRLNRLRGLGRHIKIFKRIVRQLGTKLENGWWVLDPKPPVAGPERRRRQTLRPRYGAAQ